MRLYLPKFNCVASNTFFTFEDLNLPTRRRILSSKDPKEAFKCSSAAWKRKGMKLRSGELKRLTGDSLNALRSKAGIFDPKSRKVNLTEKVDELELVLELEGASAVDAILVHRNNHKAKHAKVKTDARSKKIATRQAHAAKRAENRKESVRARKISNKSIYAPRAKVFNKIKENPNRVDDKLFARDEKRIRTKKRTLEIVKKRNKDIEIYEGDSLKYTNTHVARASHSERGGNSLHPRKAVQVKKRHENTDKKVKNHIYTENLLQAHRDRRAKRIAARKAKKAAKRVEIIPESIKVPKDADLPDPFKYGPIMGWNYLHRHASYRDIIETMFESTKNDDWWHEGVDFLVSFLNWAYQMYRSTTMLDYISACTSMCSALGISIRSVYSLLESFCTYFCEHMKDLKNRINPESLSTHMDFVSEIFSKIEGSEFIGKVRDMLLALLSFKIFDKDFSRSIYRVIGPPPKGTYIDILKSVYSGLTYFVKFGERIISGERLSNVLVSNSPVLTSIENVKELLKKENMTYSGLPVPGFVDVVVYYKEISDLIEDMTSIKQTMSRADPNGASFEIALSLLYKLQYRVDKGFKGPRVPPVAIVVHGPPGIGKSEIIKWLAKLFSHSRGRKFDQSMVFPRCLGSDYHEGYTHSTNIVHYSELGNVQASLVKTKGDPLLTELQSLVDSLPYSANMAFDDKGKMYMTPELILIDTNNKLMNAQHVMYDLGAFLRRFIFIDVSVLPKFRVEGSLSLDRTKSLQAEGYLLDRYTFTVTQFMPSTNPKEPTESTLLSGDLSALRDFLIGHFQDHLSKQNQLQERLGTDEDDAYFAELNLPVNDPAGDDVKYPELVEDTRVFRKLIDPESFKIMSYSKSVFNGFWDKSSWTMCQMKASYTNSILHWCDISRAFAFFAILYLLSSVWFNVSSSVRRGIRFLFLIFSMSAFLSDSMFGSVFFIFLLFMLETNDYFDLGFVRSHYEKQKRYLKYLIFGGEYNPFVEANWYKYAGAAVSIVATLTLMTKMFKKGLEFHSESLVSESGNGVYEEYNKYEAEMKIMPNRRRVKNAEHAAWNIIMDNNLGKIVNTHDSLTLNPVITKNLKLVRTGSNNGEYELTYMFGVGSTCAIINKHALSSSGVTEILVSKASTRENFTTDGGKTIVLNAKNSVDLGNDLVLFDTGMFQFKDILKHLLPEPPAFENARGTFCGDSVSIRRIFDGVLDDKKNGPIYLDLCYTYEYPEHGPGTCGIPLCIDHNGKSAIIGMHIGGLGNSSQAFSSPLIRNDIASGMKKLRQQVKLIQPHSFSVCGEFECEPPIQKSSFKHVSLEHIDYFGKVKGPVMVNDRTNIRKSRGSEVLCAALERAGIPHNEDYLPPTMKAGKKRSTGEYVSPYNNFYNKMNKEQVQLDWTVLEKVVEVLTERIVRMLRERGITEISPLTLAEAINGVDGDPFVRRVNASTAAGFGYQGKKDKYIPLAEGTTREPTPELVERLCEMIKSYQQGETVSPINSGSLKDETRPAEKARDGSTRVFFVTPIDYLILSRQMLSSFYTLMVEHGDIFGCSVGINMHRGADNFMKELLAFSELLFEGDYRAYDITTPPDIARAASTVVYNVCKEFGYTEFALQILIGILSDDMFPLMELLKDIFQKAGAVASGRYATAESNSLRGVIMLMYNWYSTPELAHLNFFEFVKPSTYGDDVLAAVKHSVIEYFNVVRYSDQCKKNFNMGFTSASKGDVVRKYETVDTCTYLKRRFRKHESGRWVAPLEPSSIHRAIEWIDPSNVVTECDQTIGVYQSMLYEVMFHTLEEGYNLVRDAMLGDLSLNHGLRTDCAQDYLPSYSILYSRLFGVEEIIPESFSCPSCEDYAIEDLDILREECYLAQCASLNISTLSPQLVEADPPLLIINWIARNRTNTERLIRQRAECQARMSELDQLILETKGPDLPNSAMFHNSAIYENMPIYNAVSARRSLAMEREDVKCTIESINHILGKSLVFKPESMPMDSLGSGAVSDQNLTTNQNVTDIMGAGMVTADAGRSLSLNNGQSGILPIEDFLDRPVEIATGTIAVAGSLSAQYPVWDLLTKHPSVRAKIKNFAFMRCNLVVRVAVSGSPFHTGRIMLSYQPHAGKNRNLIAHAANLAAAATYRPILLNYLSQADGAKVLDVRANTPVEIKIPFISVKPMNRLFNATSSAIAAATSFTDFADMGKLYVYTLNAIGSVSASSASPVGYSIFAWLEDVELSVPTATHLAITTESFVMGSKDERESGPVERISSALVDLSTAACAIPEMAPFAFPAQIVFRGVNALASHYGWSRPNIVSEPSYVKHRPFANSANCIGSETVELLSYDPKRQLASDSHPCGSGMDDMCIASIAQRESYIETFTWAAADAAYESIKELIVHPQMNSYFVDAGVTPCTIVQPSAMSFAVSPFSYWRGDIIFRLDFVTSQYHRGKFAIWYEPNHHHQALIAADLALNKNDVQIIDIAETNSVEIVVQWANSFPWLKTVNFANIKGIHNPGALLLNLTDVVNGHIVMAPFVPLQSPDDSDVEINVFVRAENLLVEEMGGSMPTARVYITPESYVVHEDKSCEDVSNFVLNPSTASVEHITKHYFGELPLSFRACLKRYVTMETQQYTATGTHEYVRVHRPILPSIAPLYNSTTITSPASPTLYGYLRYAFLGLRGGVRWRTRCLERDAATYQAVSSVGLLPPVETSSSTNTEVNSPIRISHSGHVQFCPSVSGPSEVELPFYTNNNFVFSFADDLMGTAVEGEMSRVWTKDFSFQVENRGLLNDVMWFVRDFAVAEDFTLMRYQGAPYYTY